MGWKTVREILEALPAKALIAGEYVDAHGGVCAVGALIREELASGHFQHPEALDLEEGWSVPDLYRQRDGAWPHPGREAVKARFEALGVGRCELRALQMENDRDLAAEQESMREETEGERWRRVLSWVGAQEAKG